MADQTSLRIIGFAFGAVTATVVLVAAMLVSEAAHDAAPVTASVSAPV